MEVSTIGTGSIAIGDGEGGRGTHRRAGDERGEREGRGAHGSLAARHGDGLLGTARPRHRTDGFRPGGPLRWPGWI